MDLNMDNDKRPPNNSLRESITLMGQQKEKDLEAIVIKENNWMEINNKDISHIIRTAGCGAIKIFVETDKHKREIVFHSFGTKDSIHSARDIAGYINNFKNIRSIHVLNIQPYCFSNSIHKTVLEMTNSIEDKSVNITRDDVILNNIKGEFLEKFVCIDLKGTQEEILKRYENLIIKADNISKKDRNAKIELFIQLPASVRTRDFIYNWSKLDLVQAEEEFLKIQKPKRKAKGLVNLVHSLYSSFDKTNNKFK